MPSNFLIILFILCIAPVLIASDNYTEWAEKNTDKMKENSVHYMEWAKQNANKTNIEVFKNLIDDKTDFFEKKSYPVLFISSSIPQIVLRNYLPDLEREGGVMVLRGLIDNIDFIKPTLQFIYEILKKTPECHYPDDCELFNVEILIDPYLFREYQITQVPALTMLSEKISHCYETLDISRLTIVGDRSLKYLMREWREARD